MVRERDGGRAIDDEPRSGARTPHDAQMIASTTDNFGLPCDCGMTPHRSGVRGTEVPRLAVAPRILGASATFRRPARQASTNPREVGASGHRLPMTPERTEEGACAAENGCR